MFLRLSAGLLPFLLAFLTATIGANSRASELRIAATVAPVHSLIAMVAGEITEPSLIIRPGASPHGYALRPSEMRALDQADVVFWVGEVLEPSMAKAVTTLAGDAVVIKLSAVDDIKHLAFRTGGVWQDDDHHEDEHDHHDHESGVDPHLWLNPDNALIWLTTIANTLAAVDPAHAEDYRRNADHAAERVIATVAEIDRLLMPIREKRYVVFHDAYQYFERRFGLHPLGSISLSDADRPGPARLIEVKEAISRSGAVCIFAEPQFEPKLIETVIEGTNVKKGILDPVGAELELGPELYPLLLRRLAENLQGCLG